jgi:hypothetical protein
VLSDKRNGHWHASLSAMRHATAMAATTAGGHGHDGVLELVLLGSLNWSSLRGAWARLTRVVWAATPHHTVLPRAQHYVVVT